VRLRAACLSVSQSSGYQSMRANGAIPYPVPSICPVVGELCGDLNEKELKSMSLGLSHSMSRYKLSFSSEKVDTMII
jgi:RNA processing factor Prp31